MKLQTYLIAVYGSALFLSVLFFQRIVPWQIGMASASVWIFVAISAMARGEGRRVSAISFAFTGLVSLQVLEQPYDFAMSLVDAFELDSLEHAENYYGTMAFILHVVQCNLLGLIAAVVSPRWMVENHRILFFRHGTGQLIVLVTFAGLVMASLSAVSVGWGRFFESIL
ncbi:MAG: hypothetical protein AAF664_26555, partial [Planctomycetota bacterium]